MAFDLLMLEGKDYRPLPLAVRRVRLNRLVERANLSGMMFSYAFKDGTKLFAECEKRNLEGVVAKRGDLPYRSGKRAEWVKVKCPTWREANKERWRMFEK